jgi:aspartokinase/homoserine dehydrogenase 1
MSEKVKVLKFGGSSIATAERIRVVKQIVEKQNEPCIIVFSALQGVTDQLIRLCHMARTRNELYREELDTIFERHVVIVKELITPALQPTVLANVRSMFNELEDALHGVFLLREITPRSQDHIIGYGERLSSYILSFIIEHASWLDSREFIRTDAEFGNANVMFDVTNPLVEKYLFGLKGRAVIPGFIASTTDNESTTLGRGGSDYTASIVASALGASVLEIWTDVDGFMTADPRKVSKAYAIDAMSYAEAIELSHFGAKVIYTPTIQPVYLKNIPLLIKNTFNPEAQGTLINSQPVINTVSSIKGISSIDDVNLLTLQGTGMVGVMGSSMRLFGALAKAKVNVILITQASSEFSITFAVRPEDCDIAVKTIHDEFEVEIRHKESLSLIVEKGLSIIAIVGEQMKNMPGVSATLFHALARNGISVIAVAQGSSELNISIAIRKTGLKKALNAIHEGFFLSGYKEMNLFQIGIGTVGGILLKQLAHQRDKLLVEHRLKINLVGVSNSRKMLLKPDGIELSDYRNELDHNGEPANISAFIEKMKELNLRNSVFIDCTAEGTVATHYLEILDNFVSVVTANKIACSSEYSIYKKLKETAKKRNVRFNYETNVGAGLPIINTINELVISGDKILKLEAVLSGTLNFVFNNLSAECPLSESVKKAKEMGYSEPDPRIDLSGIDVVRKLLILSREAGYPIEKQDVTVESFLPAECFEGSVDDFFEKLKKYDTDFESKRQKLVKNNQRWRFVASFDHGKVSVGLRTVDASHPAYSLEGSNNIVLITTERYNELPMVIKGYGAGAEVTAAGVFADLMRVANV